MSDGYFAPGMVPVKFAPYTIEGRISVCSLMAFHTDSDPDPYQPSSIRLPYYEYRGSGSPWALDFCGTCGIGADVHTYRYGTVDADICDQFVQRGPADFDAHYDGCQGWENS